MDYSAGDTGDYDSQKKRRLIINGNDFDDPVRR